MLYSGTSKEDYQQGGLNLNSSKVLTWVRYRIIIIFLSERWHHGLQNVTNYSSDDRSLALFMVSNFFFFHFIMKA